MEMMNVFSLDKSYASNKNFNRFIAGCMKDLSEAGKTICYTIEQVASLSAKAEISYIKMDGYYEVKLIKECK